MGVLKWNGRGGPRPSHLAPNLNGRDALPRDRCRLRVRQIEEWLSLSLPLDAIYDLRGRPVNGSATLATEAPSLVILQY